MTRFNITSANRLRFHVALLVCGVSLLGHPRHAFAVLDDAAAAALAANLDALSSGQNIPLATDTAQLLMNPQATDADWGSFFTTFFNTRPFTQPLAEFLTFAASQFPALAPRPAFVAATAAAAAAAPALSGIISTGKPADYGSLLYSLNTLQSVLPVLPVESRGPVFALMTSKVQGQTLDLTPVLQTGPAGNPPTALLAMQICLTLSAYAGQGPQRAAVATLLRLPDRMRNFWLSTGAFLFDNGALSDAQAVSLDSLMRSFAAGLHDIVALAAPEAYGLAGNLPGLVVAGQIVPIPAITMDMLTDPAQFIVEGPSPVAPDFTATAAVNIFRAVQAVQFARRPQLALRRDAILARAGVRDVFYLRRGVLPEVYMAQPEEFLPQTAYLWLISSEAAFRMAMDFFSMLQPAPVESLLLVADVLSNGGDVTLAFAISPEGIVASGPTAIGRAFAEDIPVAVPDGVNFLPNLQVNSIFMLGQRWYFTMEPNGQLSSLVREGEFLPL